MTMDPERPASPTPPPKAAQWGYEPTSTFRHSLTVDELLEEQFSHHRPDETQEARYMQIRGAALTLARVIVQVCPHSADRSAALRKVREAMMTANESIALAGLE